MVDDLHPFTQAGIAGRAAPAQRAVNRVLWTGQARLEPDPEENSRRRMASFDLILNGAELKVVWKTTPRLKVKRMLLGRRGVKALHEEKVSGVWTKRLKRVKKGDQWLQTISPKLTVLVTGSVCRHTGSVVCLYVPARDSTPDSDCVPAQVPRLVVGHFLGAAVDSFGQWGRLSGRSLTLTDNKPSPSAIKTT